MKKQIREIIAQHVGGTYEAKQKCAEEILRLFSVVEQSEQLPESKKLCIINQNFVCNCIDDSRCPNF